MLNLTDKCTVTLEVQLWNTVLTYLADGPFKAVAPLLQEIQTQLQAQDKTDERSIQ